MQKLRLMLDYSAGPLWEDDFDETKLEWITGIKIIDEDIDLQKINKQIQDLYTSYYHIDYNDLPVWFDKEQEKKDKDKMLALFAKLKNRLDEINDGTFEIEDLETERLKNL